MALKTIHKTKLGNLSRRKEQCILTIKNRTICSHGNDTFNPCGRVPLALRAVSGYYKGSDEGLPRVLLRGWKNGHNIKTQG